mmetsp:Transcript_24339/g.54210  ORF Transcript_24339/g.54210 Transcript_24339/m.54210 type:complete len:208 (+) Transcript_24339:1290-1913(+)
MKTAFATMTPATVVSNLELFTNLARAPERTGSSRLLHHMYHLNAILSSFAKMVLECWTLFIRQTIFRPKVEVPTLSHLEDLPLSSAVEVPDLPFSTCCDVPALYFEASSVCRAFVEHGQVEGTTAPKPPFRGSPPLKVSASLCQCSPTRSLRNLCRVCSCSASCLERLPRMVTFAWSSSLRKASLSSATISRLSTNCGSGRAATAWV